MEMTTDNAPTTEERAKFFINNSIKHVGYTDMLNSVTDARDEEEAVEKLARETHEGARRVMQNRREHGAHPINAFEYALEEEYPDWFVVGLAESEYNIFEGDPDVMLAVEEEYLDYLEEEYDVPR